MLVQDASTWLRATGRSVRAVRQAVQKADRSTEDPYARMVLFGSAYCAQSVAGLEDHAFSQIGRGCTGQKHYRGRNELGREPGTATRFERSTGYVRMLVRLTPDAEVHIEDTAIALPRR